METSTGISQSWRRLWSLLSILIVLGGLASVLLALLSMSLEAHATDTARAASGANSGTASENHLQTAVVAANQGLDPEARGRVVLYEGSHLKVTQILTQVVVENSSGIALAVRVSWDGCDPYGTCPPGCVDCFLDNWVLPQERSYLPLKNHYSMQCWAWNSQSTLVDRCDLPVVPPSPGLPSPPIKPPTRLAIYYGWPSLVNDCNGDLDCATDAFAQFDLVVLADALVHASHPEYTNTITIVNNLESGDTDVYGYTDLTLDLTTVLTYVNKWAGKGVTGIFLDRAGQDFGVGITTVISVVGYMHDLDLLAFVNAWNPDDVLSGTTPLTRGDWYLAESHPVTDDLCLDLESWWEKSQKCAQYRDQLGIRIATVSTGDDNSCNNWPNRPSYRASLWATYLFGFDAFGFTNSRYGASGPGAARLCRLPPLPADVGTVYLASPTGPITIANVSTFGRLTDKGTVYVYGICDGAFVHPSLTVSKQATSGPLEFGSPLTYTLRVTNTSILSLTATITDFLPSRVSPNDVLTWTPTITAPDGVWTEHVVVIVQSGCAGPLTNTVDVASREGASGSRASVVVHAICKGHYLPVVMRSCCSEASILAGSDCSDEEK